MSKKEEVADLIGSIQTGQRYKKSSCRLYNTQKGKGYKLAEEHKEDWHYCAPFDGNRKAFLDSFDGEDFKCNSTILVKENERRQEGCKGSLLATPTVMDLQKIKRKEAGKQFIDVGIAEETAMAMAAGIAGGGKNRFMEYIQHLYRENLHDQINIMDLCIDSNAATIVTSFWGSVYGMTMLLILDYRIFQ